MFVIMISKGEYSDRWVGLLGYTASEDRAKELVAEYVRADQLERSIEDAKLKIHLKAIELIDAEYPYPTHEKPEKPAFDQSKHKDKEYVAAHIQRKAAYNKAEIDYHEEFIEPWYERRAKFTEQYVEENFTMDFCEPPKWTDAQYYYEQIEELI